MVLITLHGLSDLFIGLVTFLGSKGEMSILPVWLEAVITVFLLIGIIGYSTR